MLVTKDKDLVIATELLGIMKSSCVFVFVVMRDPGMSQFFGGQMGLMFQNERFGNVGTVQNVFSTKCCSNFALNENLSRHVIGVGRGNINHDCIYVGRKSSLKTDQFSTRVHHRKTICKTNRSTTRSHSL